MSSTIQALRLLCMFGLKIIPWIKLVTKFGWQLTKDNLRPLKTLESLFPVTFGRKLHVFRWGPERTTFDTPKKINLQLPVPYLQKTICTQLNTMHFGFYHLSFKIE